MLRVVCDTNVLVSAFIAAGPPSRLVEEVLAGRLALILPIAVINELERVLTEKLGFEDAQWRQVKALLLDVATEVAPRPDDMPEAMTGDRDDDVILATAVRARVDAVVSGDHRHLLPLGEHNGIRIVTPQALLAELRN